jgi:hypothetical protein
MASGNVIYRLCFRIMMLNCDIWSADVRDCMSPSRAIVTHLVTQVLAERFVAILHAAVACRRPGGEVTLNPSDNSKYESGT